MAVPLTFGQLAIWRDIENIPPHRWHQPNLTQTWPLPAGTSTAAVHRALADLAARHESLRTTYDLSDRRVPGQVPHPPGRYPLDVEDRDGTGTDPGTVAAQRSARAFHLGREPAWRASVIGPAGEPTHLVVVAHHIVADRAGLLALRRDFLAALRGPLDGPAPGPEQIHRYEQSPAGQRWNAEALGYWERLLAEAPVPPDVEDEPLVEASLASRALLETGQRAARRLRVPLAAVVLSAFHAALSTMDGPDRVLVRLLSANRLEPRRAHAVTSMNQWIGMVCDRTPVRDVATTARQVAGRARIAYAHGVYDVDRLFAMLAGAGYRPGQYDRTWSFNFMPPDGGAPLDGHTVPVAPGPDGGAAGSVAAIGWAPAPSSVGPRNYLRVAVDGELSLALRVPDTPAGRARATRLLTGIRRFLRDAAGT